MIKLSRRGFLSAAAATLAATSMPGMAGEPRRRKPNVLLIVTDDHGSVDVNCYGAKDLVTPNLDRLAADGIRFTQFYAASSVCSPSRAAIMTGRYPQRAGLAGNAGHHPGAVGMPASQVTIAEMMKAAGYATGHVGKWHMGYIPATMPNGQGFDYSFGHMSGCIDNYSHFYYWGGPNRHDLWRNGVEVWHEGEHFADLMVRECNGFMERHREEPFFLYWAINMPHYPLQGTAKWRERYKELPEPRRHYAASVSTLDERIGQVLARLDELGLREETIVIFQSDQGHSTEDRTFYGGGDAGPYRGAKASLFEGGIRIPAIVRWPGRLGRGETRGQMVTGCDWMPTIAELCGVALPERRIDGRSIGGVLASSSAASPHEVFHWMLDKQWAVREGDWKLLGNPSDPGKPALGPEDRLFLVNIAEDPSERRNLAREHPDRVERLKGLHEAWVKDVQEQ